MQEDTHFRLVIHTCIFLVHIRGNGFCFALAPATLGLEFLFLLLCLLDLLLGLLGFAALGLLSLALLFL